ncbi:MAG: hypothetical protein A2Z17_06865 [Gammaproteobacteria bacterium RBG_16_66_13]|nr:MAG: hypothetical protein A2Z17_06865 [Gammaproteobacteria bacterium RBG_16_66_13]
MAGSGFSVEVEGLEKLQRKLGGALTPAKTMIGDLARYVQAELKKGAKPHAADKGTLAEGVKLEMSATGQPLGATVGFFGRGYGARSSMGAIAPTVNYGRRPGKRPSVQAIGRWAKAHGISTNPWVLARNIAREGTKGVLFLEKAEEAGRKKAQEMMGKLAVEIEKRFGS